MHNASTTLSRVDEAPARVGGLRRSAHGDTIGAMAQRVLAPVPIHGEYRERGDKVD